MVIYKLNRMTSVTMQAATNPASILHRRRRFAYNDDECTTVIYPLVSAFMNEKVRKTSSTDTCAQHGSGTEKKYISRQIPRLRLHTSHYYYYPFLAITEDHRPHLRRSLPLRRSVEYSQDLST